MNIPPELQQSHEIEYIIQGSAKSFLKHKCSMYVQKTSNWHVVPQWKPQIKDIITKIGFNSLHSATAYAAIKNRCNALEHHIQW